MIQTDFKNLISRIKSSFDYDHEKFVMNPDRDWRSLIMLFFAINILITIFSFYVFTKINSDDIFVVKSDNNSEVMTISREKLDSAVFYIKNKNEELNILMSNKPVIIDPSN